MNYIVNYITTSIISHELRGGPHLRHMLPALRLRSGRTAAWYATILCVRFSRAERGKTAHQQKSVPRFPSAVERLPKAKNADRVSCMTERPSYVQPCPADRLHW